MRIRKRDKKRKFPVFFSMKKEWPPFPIHQTVTNLVALLGVPTPTDDCARFVKDEGCYYLFSRKRRGWFSSESEVGKKMWQRESKLKEKRKPNGN